MSSNPSSWLPLLICKGVYRFSLRISDSPAGERSVDLGSTTIMKWITRERVKVDRVACPWLIRKFVDKHAEFFFVPTGKVADEAQRIGAIPFDLKDVELGHHGEECSFEAILK